MILQVP